jgi:hypothetical protein
MQSVSPVWTDAEVEIERVIALDQPQYQPIIILPVRYSDGTSGLSVRFRLSDEERAAIAAGEDLSWFASPTKARFNVRSGSLRQKTRPLRS